MLRRAGGQGGDHAEASLTLELLHHDVARLAGGVVRPGEVDAVVCLLYGGQFGGGSEGEGLGGGSGGVRIAGLPAVVHGPDSVVGGGARRQFGVLVGQGRRAGVSHQQVRTAGVLAAVDVEAAQELGVAPAVGPVQRDLLAGKGRGGQTRGGLRGGRQGDDGIGVAVLGAVAGGGHVEHRPEVAHRLHAHVEEGAGRQLGQDRLGTIRRSRGPGSAGAGEIADLHVEAGLVLAVVLPADLDVPGLTEYRLGEDAAGGEEQVGSRDAHQDVVRACHVDRVVGDDGCAASIGRSPQIDGPESGAAAQREGVEAGAGGHVELGVVQGQGGGDGRAQIPVPQGAAVAHGVDAAIRSADVDRAIRSYGGAPADGSVGVESPQERSQAGGKGVEPTVIPADENHLILSHRRGRQVDTRYRLRDADGEPIRADVELVELVASGPDGTLGHEGRRAGSSAETAENVRQSRAGDAGHPQRSRHPDRAVRSHPGGPVGQPTQADLLAQVQILVVVVEGPARDDVDAVGGHGRRVVHVDAEHGAVHLQALGIELRQVSLGAHQQVALAVHHRG